MEKQRKVYWAKRNGMEALVLGRVAVPSYMAEIAIVLLVVAIVGGVVVGTTMHIWWMALPGFAVVAGLALWGLWNLLRAIVLDFVTVNRKDL